MNTIYRGFSPKWIFLNPSGSPVSGKQLQKTCHQSCRFFHTQNFTTIRPLAQKLLLKSQHLVNKKLTFWPELLSQWSDLVQILRGKKSAQCMACLLKLFVENRRSTWVKKDSLSRQCPVFSPIMVPMKRNEAEAHLKALFMSQFSWHHHIFLAFYPSYLDNVSMHLSSKTKCLIKSYQCYSMIPWNHEELLIDPILFDD